ncbi:16S rRNA (guanine(527)-N(7))-methyltransferase RsmG [Peloplasma aerotolerans]|uniref:Ribosomal RNA small subunit methyltransferase G n=1 Tax=Peloplasma aerotolerans TaxID=3044389 RepID=A0AAW6U6U5_9MOLU|nr:16S rRNA (guanine(527)-N(7))-methyltransferase RsmG [Mariniplasma sp. M4Ah]MDI6453667.1 16S rRNA (guanine(527)-N(7))-methyltransferase RsmG [Mariniplasma sp. M4Ah]
MSVKEDLLRNLKISLDEKQEEQFEKYYAFLIEYNKKINLTRITEKKEVYYKHFYDSLTIVQTVDMANINSICDMGSGAGFPSIPLKIIYPDLDVTIIDSLNKRITFLNELTNLLEISNVHLIHDRIETFAIKHQKKYDLVIARALGNMQLITEMGLPMTKPGGYLVAYKALNYDLELSQASACINKLGGKISDVRTFELPQEFGHRVHVVVNKVKHVDGYPRSFVKMTKNPL